MTQFETIYRDYFQDVFRYAMALTRDPDRAEELTAETFFKAMKGLNAFRGDCDVKAWLCRIAKNSYYSVQRTAKRHPQEPLPEGLPGSMDLEQSVIQQELSDAAHQVLHQLPEPYREVFTLRVLGELPFRKIGALFGKSENWACVTYHRAKQKMIAGLEDAQ